MLALTTLYILFWHLEWTISLFFNFQIYIWSYHFLTSEQLFLDFGFMHNSVSWFAILGIWTNHLYILYLLYLDLGLIIPWQLDLLYLDFGLTISRQWNYYIWTLDIIWTLDYFCTMDLIFLDFNVFLGPWTYCICVSGLTISGLWTYYFWILVTRALIAALTSGSPQVQIKL